MTMVNLHCLLVLIKDVLLSQQGTDMTHHQNVQSLISIMSMLLSADVKMFYMPLIFFSPFKAITLLSGHKTFHGVILRLPGAISLKDESCNCPYKKRDEECKQICQLLS